MAGLYFRLEEDSHGRSLMPDFLASCAVSLADDYVQTGKAIFGEHGEFILVAHEIGHCIDDRDRPGAGGPTLAREVFADTFSLKLAEVDARNVSPFYLGHRKPPLGHALEAHSTFWWVVPFIERTAKTVDDAVAIARNARDACLADTSCREGLRPPVSDR